MSEEHKDVTGRPRDLESELRRLGQLLDVPAPPDYAARVRERLPSAPNRPSVWRRRTGMVRPLRPLAAAAIVVVLAVAVVLSVPATREAVADLFGLSGVGVRSTPTAVPSPRTTLDTRLDLGEPVTLDEARERASFPVSVPTVAELGAPDGVYQRRQAGLESVSLVYRPRPGFPAVFDTEVGVLVSEYAGTAAPYFEKLIGSEEPVTQVMVADRWPGLYFSSPHAILVRGPDGVVHEDRPRLAASTLVWVQDGVTYRLESAVDLERALEVAASVR
jgi:hypothetical protein